MPDNDMPATREFELTLKRGGANKAGGLSPAEEEELRKLREQNANAMKRRYAQTENG